MSANNTQIKRYSASERGNHWLVAVTFVLLALSGLALFHPSMFWLTGLFGGGTWTRILHPFVGVVMFLGFLMLSLRFWRHNLMNRNDRQWLRRIGDVISKREERLPPVGRYNGGQKLLFWVMVVLTLALMVSGVLIWQPYFAPVFALTTLQLAVVVHAATAILLMLGIIVHVYAAIWVQGTMGAMVRGTVSRAWARKHHPAWQGEIVGEGQPQTVFNKPATGEVQK